PKRKSIWVILCVLEKGMYLYSSVPLNRFRFSNEWGNRPMDNWLEIFVYRKRGPWQSIAIHSFPQHSGHTPSVQVHNRIKNTYSPRFHRLSHYSNRSRPRSTPVMIGRKVWAARRSSFKMH